MILILKCCVFFLQENFFDRKRFHSLMILRAMSKSLVFQQIIICRLFYLHFPPISKSIYYEAKLHFCETTVSRILKSTVHFDLFVLVFRFIVSTKFSHV